MSSEAPRLMTVEAWVKLGEDVPGELVDGRLEPEEPADYVHEIVVSWMTATLRGWVAKRGGCVRASGAKLVLHAREGRRPDVALYFDEKRVGSAPPDLVVEVIAPTQRDAVRDRVEKFASYAAFGVGHYWLVDQATRIFEAYALPAPGAGYSRTIAGHEARIAVPGFDGLSLDLGELWMETERLSMGPSE